MKKLSGVISVFLIITIIFQLNTASFAAAKTNNRYSSGTYTHQDKHKNDTIINGIDVSEHNGDIDFNRVKADGIDFVFVRVGYTGYTKSMFSTNYDKKYKKNIKNAIKAGLDVGVYWYSQAIKTDEARKEAELTLKAIKDYDITLPVVFDYEFAGTRAGRLDSKGLSASKKTSISLTFLDTVAAAGYDACIYASKDFLVKQLNADKIEAKHRVWLAHYTNKTDYEGNYEYWQYTSEGHVDGISGRVDMNFRYYDGFERIEDQIYTGKEITPSPLIKFKGKELREGKDYTLKYDSNIDIGTAVITVEGTEKYKELSRTYEFRIVPPKVKGLTFIKKNMTSLKYEWRSVETADDYTILVENKTRGTYFTLRSDTNKATISGLTAGNIYRVRVCANKYIDEKCYSSPYSASDKQSTTGATIRDLRVAAAKTNSLKLKWDKDGTAEKYEIFAYNEKNKDYVKIAETTDKFYIVDNLKAGSKHRFRVRAVNGEKASPKSDTLKAATKPNKVALKSAKSKKRSRITVRWKRRVCSGYEVQWSTYKSFKNNYKSVYVSSKKNAKTLKTAQTGRKYYVRVRAYTTTDGVKTYGEWSKGKAVWVK